jgi:hypothetical protein
MMASLPLTAALSPLAAEHGVDLTSLAKAEMEFERKLHEVSEWLKSTRRAETGQDIAQGRVL